MSTAPNETSGLFRADRMKFPGFDVSYVGEGPSPDELWFGSDDGRILLATLDAGVKQGPLPASESREAINGVTSIDNHTAVSTRHEISIFTVHPEDSHKAKRAVFPAGAHGVVKSPSGWFVAPLGTPGVLLIKPEEGGAQRITITRARDREFYFYRVANLGTSQGSETLVFATRRGGITSMSSPAQAQPRRLSWITFPGLDVVDVCPLANTLSTPAACAIGKDGTLVMSRDVLSDRNPAAVRFDGVAGTAYRVFSARGHAFLLTNTGMYILYNIVSRFLEGKRIDDAPTAVREFPADAVDANLVFDRHLLLVTPDDVLRFDLDLLGESKANGSLPQKAIDRSPMNLTPAWESNESDTTCEPALCPVG